MKKIFLILSFVIFCTCSYGQNLVSQDALEAAFIFHFINFTEWTDDQPEYNICIPDDDELRSAVEQSLKGKVVNNRKINVVNRYEKCHILVSNIVPPPSQNTLTIGPLAKGALLEFRVISNKLKFAANPETIKKSKLKISSQLLKLAILENGA